MQRPSWHIWFLDAQSESILHSEIFMKSYYEIELSNRKLYSTFRLLKSFVCNSLRKLTGFSTAVCFITPKTCRVGKRKLTIIRIVSIAAANQVSGAIIIGITIPFSNTTFGSRVTAVPFCLWVTVASWTYKQNHYLCKVFKARGI